MCVSRLENCNISGVECGKIECEYIRYFNLGQYIYDKESEVMNWEILERIGVLEILIFIPHLLTICLIFQEPEILSLDNSAQIFNALSDVPGDVQDVDDLIQVRKLFLVYSFMV
jgi:hypothetical protein